MEGVPELDKGVIECQCGHSKPPNQPFFANQKAVYRLYRFEWQGATSLSPLGAAVAHSGRLVWEHIRQARRQHHPSHTK